MAKRFLNKKTHRFYYKNLSGKRKSYVLIFGDEIKTLRGQGPGGRKWKKVEYRGRRGEMKAPPLISKRSLEMYFLDVGQGDAAFIVTPNNTKILVDGGSRNRALGFLIWKFRLDDPVNTVIIDHLILSHGDKDHVGGLISILNHPQIQIKNIYHNGIAVFKSGFNTVLGHITTAKKLTTLHDSTDDLDGEDLSNTFRDWIQSVKNSGATYQAINAKMASLDIGDPAINIEILGPVLEKDGQSLQWFSDKAHTINGHSVVFRLSYDQVRVLFSGDLNVKGSKHLLANATLSNKLDAHVFKSPHHGSHEYHQPLFNMVSPMITVVSSGDSPDHGHPRAQFLGAIVLSSRSKKPLLFSTEIAATFVDSGDERIVAFDRDSRDISDIDFSKADANVDAHRLFKKALTGIINIRSDGKYMYAARRVQAGYQWESYNPIKPINN